MHENRETSATPAVQPDSRTAGEGSGRTARADVPEESHDGIVPMNHSNEDKGPLAENEEGRPSIKENACQPHTYPTQSGKGVSQGLAGVRQAARENKEMKFTAHEAAGVLRRMRCGYGFCLGDSQFVRRADGLGVVGRRVRRSFNSGKATIR
jgi:RNA-directed DNA polymerase